MAQRRGEEVERCRSVSTIQRMIGGKWKIEILFYIALKEDGFLTRTDFGEVPPRVEYALTPQGKSFVPILLAMKHWGEAELGL